MEDHLTQQSTRILNQEKMAEYFDRIKGGGGGGNYEEGKFIDKDTSFI